MCIWTCQPLVYLLFQAGAPGIGVPGPLLYWLHPNFSFTPPLKAPLRALTSHFISPADTLLSELTFTFEVPSVR